MSLLGITASDIFSELNKISFPESMVSTQVFNSFESRKKTNYIRAFEQVYCSHQLFYSLASSMNCSFEKLEHLKIVFMTYIKKHRPMKGNIHRNQEIVAAWQIFFLMITTLFSILKDTKEISKGKRSKPLLSEKDFCNRYPELNYCRLLRNDYIQHPSLLLGTQFNRSITYPGNPDLLPYFTVAPDGYGWTNYYMYHRNKTGKKFRNLPDEKIREQNKNDYIANYGWKPKAYRNRNNKTRVIPVVHRIKGFGLPDPDQNRLSEELRKIFKEVIFPYLKRKQRQALKWGFGW